MKLLDRLSEFLFPLRCPCCGEISDRQELCAVCAEKLDDCRISGEICRKCGVSKAICRCSSQNFLFAGICAPFFNRDEAQEYVYSFKFRNMPYAAAGLGKEIADCFSARFPTVKPDMICFVPSRKASMRHKYYDYVRLLASRVSENLGVPLNASALKKVRKNRVQHKLRFDERQANVKGAFAADGRMDGKTVLLIDDIKTTGSTLNECAKQLRLSGAERVFSAVAVISAKSSCNNNKFQI